MSEPYIIIKDKLKVIRTYLCKIGPKRRTGNILEEKFSEAEKLYLEYEELISKFTTLVSQKFIKKNIIDEVYIESNEIVTLYSEIQAYCKQEKNHQKWILSI